MFFSRKLIVHIHIVFFYFYFFFSFHKFVQDSDEEEEEEEDDADGGEGGAGKAQLLTRRIKTQEEKVRSRLLRLLQALRLWSNFCMLLLG